MEVNIRALYKEIPRVERGQRLVIGIDGLSHSGKTTFVNKIKQQLQEENVSLHFSYRRLYCREKKTL